MRERYKPCQLYFATPDECLLCGSLVTNRDQHDSWHASMDEIDEKIWRLQGELCGSISPIYPGE